MSVREELLPCPFCGSTDAFVQNAGWQANTFIRCPGCETALSISKGPRPHEASVAGWNRRAQPEPLLVQLQEICAEFGVRGGENRIDGIRRVHASSQAEIERLRTALEEARRYVAYLAGDDRTFVGSGMPSECLEMIDAALGTKP